MPSLLDAMVCDISYIRRVSSGILKVGELVQATTSCSEEVLSLTASVTSSGIYLHYLSIASHSVHLPVLNDGRAGLHRSIPDTGGGEPDK